MNYLAMRLDYWTSELTSDEYRRFANYMYEHGQNVGHTVEKLDDTFKVTLNENSIIHWEEILNSIRID
jgi:NADH/NAD ratio-sensing transcriptional regulator Rex|tara:strand:- start:1775 stop:1978 length:204 start_codon:yes stop_codon:yes gene_type:complete